jgi:hypothetical protein
MKLLRRTSAGVMALLLSAALALPAMGAVACGATGEVSLVQGEGYFAYTVTVNWDFDGGAAPDRFMLNLNHLVDCAFYDPDDPIQQLYIIPQTSWSPADGECFDIFGQPTNGIEWMGGMAMEDPDCWLPTLHVLWENNGPTIDCDVPTAGTAAFTFYSYGMPLEDEMYYGALMIKAGQYCIECDYFGPMPDCNTWAPVKEGRWGTIKALYR